jgi:hypothetical protein
MNKVAYVGKDTIRESITSEGVGAELIERAKEVIDSEYREARRKLRLLESN